MFRNVIAYDSLTEQYEIILEGGGVRFNCRRWIEALSESVMYAEQMTT